MPETTRVVRALGSSRTHVVTVPVGQLCLDEFIRLYVGVAVPVVTRCGSVLRDGQERAAVCMEPGTKVRCAQCRRITGVTVAAGDNMQRPAPTAGTDT